MTHDDASVETGVGGQAKYDVMMVFCGNGNTMLYSIIMKLSKHLQAGILTVTLHIFLYTSYVM